MPLDSSGGVKIIWLKMGIDVFDAGSIGEVSTVE